MKHITIRKPLYANKVYLRDRILLDAIHDRELIEVTIPQGSAVIDPSSWIKTGDKMLKEFKIKGRPMVLWGNYLKIGEQKDTLI